MLELIGRGFANKRIARELGVSEKTVKTHVGHVLAKLGVTDRTQAAVVAVRAGLVEPEVLGPIAAGKLRPATLVRLADMPTAIVTGASRGLGLALTRALAERGWRIVVDARDADRTGGHAGRRPHNVARHRRATSPTPQHRRALVEAAGDRSTCSSTTRACSGRARSRRSPTTRSTRCARVYEANVFAPLALVQIALPRLAPDATVINVSSDAAVEPYDGWGGYGSSKAALDQLTAILAAEQLGLRVYAVDPGDMRTQMHQEAFPGEDISDRPPPEDERARPARADRRARCPSGRYRAADLAAVRT